MLASFTLSSEACRFTVREIGFSILSQTTYSLLIADEHLSFDDPVIRRIKQAAKASNVQVVLLNPTTDKQHPLMKKALEQGISFPNVVFCGAWEKLHPLFNGSTYDAAELETVCINRVIRSPIRQQLLEHVSNTFAFVISIPGKDEKQNKTASLMIQEACKRIQDVMPLMPKEVQYPLRILTLKASDSSSEQVLLWSVGLENMPEHPHAVVVYGRGRFMGKALTMENIKEGLVYKYLAMIGADCECNLDRQWMLGTQLPLCWDEKTRQDLAKYLTFDVDNPMILAEMSRILAKEEITGNSTVSFTPETIDLDEVFDSSSDSREQVEEALEPESNTAMFVLIGTLGVLLISALLISMIIIRKKRN